MAIKPILFNTEMVKAILEGRKTQTRRTAFPNMELREFCNKEYPNGWWFNGRVFRSFDDFLHYTQRPKCKYQPGDILWVRETWSTHYDGIHDDLQLCYKADGIDLKSECLPGENNCWYPSIHMPKEAARIFLKVKNVRIEKLWEMDEVAAIAEGFEDSPAVTDSPIQRFSELWDKTIKRDDLREFGYHANPWVWVVEFERCDKPKGWCTP